MANSTTQIGKKNSRRISSTKMGQRTNVTASWRWMVIGTLLASVLLASTGHGAVIKRESSVDEQELVAEELLIAAAQQPEPRRLDSIGKTKDNNDAIRDANRISESAETKTKVVLSQKSKTNATTTTGPVRKEEVTVEPLEAADEAEETVTTVDDIPIPTFAPFDINRYTSSYRDDGVAESESLRETEAGGAYTTVDYEQRFERIELTTQASSAEFNPPSGMFKQESHRFDVNGMRMEDEGSMENNGEEEHEAATVVNLDKIKENSTAERNSSSYFNNIELESTKYEIQADELKSQGGSNQTVGSGQKRGKYLQNPEEATVIKADTNEPNLSIPSTADVWALAAMKNVEHTKKKAGFYYNETAEHNPDKEAINGTSATKTLTDWLEIMRNDEYSNGSFLGNAIPNANRVVADQEPQQSREENRVVEVVVTPPSGMQATTSARRFDESFDSATELSSNYRPTDFVDFTSPGGGLGGSRVSDNLYYDDFTTDLPDFFTTTPQTEVDPTQPSSTVRETNIQKVLSATTEAIPRNEINTVSNDINYDRKTTEAINDIVSPLESTSLAENIIPTTTTEIIRNSGIVTPAAETVTTTEEPPRIIPLVDASAVHLITTTTEKKELDQQQQQKAPEEEEAHQDKAEENLQIAQSTANPTDITNNSIEKQTETKVGESNNLPEYTVVAAEEEEQQPTAAVSGDTTNTNSNSNYLETPTSGNSPSGGGDGSSQSSANNDHEDGHGQQQTHEQQRPDYQMTTTTTTMTSGVAVSAGGESGAAEQSIAESTTARHSTISLDQTTETMVSFTEGAETKTTTMSPERIEVVTRRTNGHQMVHNQDGNDTLELGGVAPSLTADGAEATTEGRDTNAIIAITVSVIAVVALVLLVGFLYVMRKRQKQLSYGQRCQPVGLDAYSLDNVSVYNSVRRKNNNLRLSKRSYGNSAFEDPGLKFNNLSIQGLQTMMNNKEEIYEEFKEIPLITARVDEVPAGCEDKNRYANVVPLPETRVYLKQLNGDEKTEYINASYVRGPKDNTNYYIACQAPMENTIVDFWRMIWEQNSKVICMLTDLTENGIEKCAEYLPPSAVLDTNRVFGDFSVTLKNREVKDKYAVSTIHLRNTETNTWREITHFWYQWPEEGMPLDETSVIAMLLEVRSYLKMAMPEQTGDSDDDLLTQDEKQKKIQELNDELTEKLEEDGAAATATTSEDGEKKAANGTIDKSKSLQRSQGPLTVHCSPGTGRTGTIIGCDIALRSLELKNRSVDVAQTVYYVRRGRASSIKTREQYEFIYRCANTYAQKLMEPIAEN